MTTRKRAQQSRPSRPIQGGGNPAAAAPGNGSDAATPAPGTATAAEPAETAAAAPASSDTSTATVETAATTKAAKKPRGSRRAAAPAETAPEPDPDQDGDKRSGPRVLTPTSTAEGARVSLILHPDDDLMLKQKRLQDRGDANARIRALLAVYRSNQRLQDQVDRLTRTTARTPGRST